MTTTTELRRLALAATRGPWTHVGDYDRRSGDSIRATFAMPGDRAIAKLVGGGDSRERKANAAYIAAANPAAILALLDELDAARRALAEYMHDDSDLRGFSDAIVANIANGDRSISNYDRGLAALTTPVPPQTGISEMRVEEL